MSKKNILITGGTRSGKSRHALAIANGLSGEKMFLATAEPLDEEMTERIAHHKKERGPEWITIEEPLDPVSKLKESNADVLIFDCMTLWISNLMMQERDAGEILQAVRDLIAESERKKRTLIVITNEVGAGIVPDNALSRKFRDIAGEANQRLAAAFDEVVHMVSGIPVEIKNRNHSPSREIQDPEHPHAFSPQLKKGCYEAIYKRRDMRHFKSQSVKPDVLGKILDAAHHAGSVGYMQPWNFLIIDAESTRRKIAANFQQASAEAAQKFQGNRKALYESLKLEGILEAPINICVTCDRTRLGSNVLGRDSVRETDLFSTCCAVQNLWLAARAEGLAVGWVSILSMDQLRQDLAIPDHVFPVAYLCLGHTDAFYDEPMLETKGWGKRFPLEQLIFYNKWKGKPGGYRVTLPESSGRPPVILLTD